MTACTFWSSSDVTNLAKDRTTVTNQDNSTKSLAKYKNPTKLKHMLKLQRKLQQDFNPPKDYLNSSRGRDFYSTYYNHFEQTYEAYHNKLLKITHQEGVNNLQAKKALLVNEISKQQNDMEIFSWSPEDVYEANIRNAFIISVIDYTINISKK